MKDNVLFLKARKPRHALKPKGVSLKQLIHVLDVVVLVYFLSMAEKLELNILNKYVCGRDETYKVCSRQCLLLGS